MSGDDFLSTQIVLRERLSSLQRGILQQIQTDAPRRGLAAGEYLFRQGDAGRTMYILLSGRLRVLAGAPAEETAIGEIAPGEWVGELSLLTESPRSASVRAIRDSELIEISSERFEQMSRAEPELALQLARTVTARLQRMINQPRPRAGLKTVALVPLLPGLALADVARQLQAVLARTARSQLLTAAAVDEALGRDMAQEDIDAWDEKDSRLLRYLTVVEKQADFVLLQADEGWTAWTRRCLRSADLILLFGRGTMAVPEPNEIGARLFGADAYEVHAQKELVLLYEGGQTLAAGTDAWLALAPAVISAHFHLRRDHRPDFERLGRRLTGREVALCLSGGGARGFAHLGVIKAMQELGIPIDRVSGVSMGSVIGALFAGGLSLAEIRAVSYRGWQKMGPTRDYTLPLVSLLSARRVQRMLKMMFGERAIEDLWLPYFAVSSNLTQAREVIHDRGRIRDGVRASISMPGMAPPVPHEGDLLVDGAVLNNMPADVQQRRTFGRTVAVDVNPEVELRAECDYGPTLSAGRLLWSWLNPFTPAIRAPNLLAIIDRVAYLNSVRQAATLAQDENILYLHPETTPFGLLDFKRIDEIAAEGYRHAAPQLAAWWAETD